MKSLLAVFFIATLFSSQVSAGTGQHKRDVNKAAAPSSDLSAAGSSRPNAQEYIDTAHTGQAAPMRTVEKDGRCRDADGVWLHKDDIGYNTCVRQAGRVEY